MKLIFASLLFLIFVPQKTSPLTTSPVKLAVAATALATATWLAGEILKDCGHRYLDCKKIALAYASDLKKYDTEEMLTDNEITTWSVVQGMSAIPEKYWRELTALGIDTALLYIAFKSLAST